MQKSSFAVLILCGVLVACLPRLAAPSDNYISDSLGLSENPVDFYITYQPESMTASDPYGVTYLICQTNIYDDVSYQWQYSIDGYSGIYTDIAEKYSNRQVFPLPNTYSHDGFYRCACTYGDITIYTAPFSIIVPYSKKQAEPIEELTEEPTEEPTEESTEELKKGVEEIE